MKDLNIVFAGFGGQGILFAGKVVAYAGLIEGRELSWLPSYGPETVSYTHLSSVRPVLSVTRYKVGSNFIEKLLLLNFAQL